MNVEIEAKLIIDAGSKLEGLHILTTMLAGHDNIEVFELTLFRGETPVADVKQEESYPNEAY